MKEAFFVYSRDMEDADLIGFSCAIEIPKDKTNTYEEAINYLMPTLSSEEFVKELIEGDCLEDDLFEGRPYKFLDCGYRSWGLGYRFAYIGDDPDYRGEVLTHQKSVNFIKVVQP